MWERPLHRSKNSILFHSTFLFDGTRIIGTMSEPGKRGQEVLLCAITGSQYCYQVMGTLLGESGAIGFQICPALPRI